MLLNQLKEKINRISLKISDFLSGTRPVGYVRKMQLYFLVITVIGATFVLSYPVFVQKELDLNGEWALGKTAPSGVVATTSLEFPRISQFEFARKEAGNRAPLHFTRDFGYLNGRNIAEGRRSFQEIITEDTETVTLCRKNESEALLLRSCLRRGVPSLRNLSNNQIQELLKVTPDRFKELVSQYVNIIFQRYVILPEPLKVPDFTGNSVKIKDINTGGEPVENAASLSLVIHKGQLGNAAVIQAVTDIIRERQPDSDPAFTEAVVPVVIHYLRNLDAGRYNSEETEKEQIKAVREVRMPVYRIARGDLVIKKDELITDEKYEALEYYNKARFMDKLRRILAVLVQQIILIGIILYFAFRFGFRRLSDVSSNLIIFIMVWLFIITLFIQSLFWMENSEYNEVTHFFGAWVPIGLYVIVLSIIFGEVLTIPLGVYLAFLVFLASKYDPNSFMISVTIAMLGSILGSRIRKRVHFISTAVLLTAVGLLMVTASYLYSSRPVLGRYTDNILSLAYLDALRLTALSGITAVFAITILPVFESMFNVPTRFKLQELADPSNPLLQELFRKAPSTWTHTLMVAALSEKACERLGLNAILTRTGVYYHDIGKMKKPAFFIENRYLMPEGNTQAAIPPDEAAKVVIDHVVQGIEMARAARLPREVIAFIPEHHGNSVMTFFYHKALEKNRKKVSKDDFRYPGPKPQSKETAIVMIADSVEAASRSLESVTRESVENQIQKIINIKMSENQLDESGITLGDLQVVKESFTEVILSSYHNRPRYPDQSDTSRLETERAAAKPARKKKQP